MTREGWREGGMDGWAWKGMEYGVESGATMFALAGMALACQR